MCEHRRMTSDLLLSFSDALADAVAAAAPSVVQVQGGRRPASGLVYTDEVVITTVRTLGREDDLHVRRHDGTLFDATLAGWDPTTSLAVLRVGGLGAAAIVPSAAPARVGHLALAIGRSWSNAVTASAGLVAVIGGPLRTGRGRAIEQVLRTTAPMHDGFSGGAFVDTRGALLGVATSTTIRGTTVVIPASIAWKTAATVLEHGRLTRGYLGISAQPVRLPEGQRIGDRDTALLAVGVTPDGPAAKAGMLVGDLIVDLDGHAVESPEDLFDLLLGDRVGRQIPLRIVRGGEVRELPVTVGERPKG
jgi:S1-C subfamily serine protease